MNINSILFDMDGVLIDSEFAIRTCCIEALKEFDIIATHKDFFEFTGMGEDRFIGGVAEKYGKQYSLDMKTLAYRYYCERATELVFVYDGIKNMLLTLKEKGYKMAVASSADRVKVTKNLECIQVTDSLFDIIITGSEITHKKPHPEIYLTTASKILSKTENCIVIEDAISGILAAKSAGMLCIGVTSAFDGQTLRDNGADYVVGKTTEIIELIEDMNKSKYIYCIEPLKK
jgi:HAD superfamily hydrolase (TIGR01509 family)